MAELDQADRSENSAALPFDGKKTAVMILAALNGGSILSHVAQDPGPFNAALDLALAPLVTAEGTSVARTRTKSSISNMDS